jgi:hypothetical protein
VSESAVLPEQCAEQTTSPSIPVPPEAIPVPARKPKRFFASIRFNGLRFLVLTGALALAWGFIRAAMWKGSGTPEGTFMLVLSGGLLAAAAKTAIDILNWAAATRQAAYVERMRAVQRVYQHARVVREHAVLDWRRLHTVLVDHLTGRSQEIRLFHGHEDADKRAEALLRKALSEDVWIRADGIEAVERFKADIAALDYEAIATEDDFRAAFDAHMNCLRHELALAAIGISLD